MCQSARARHARPRWARIGSDDEVLQTYLTKFGETVESIANAHGVSEARLRAINHVEPQRATRGRHGAAPATHSARGGHASE